MALDEVHPQVIQDLSYRAMIIITSFMGTLTKRPWTRVTLEQVVGSYPVLLMKPKVKTLQCCCLRVLKARWGYSRCRTYPLLSFNIKEIDMIVLSAEKLCGFAFFYLPMVSAEYSVQWRFSTNIRFGEYLLCNTTCQSWMRIWNT